MPFFRRGAGAYWLLLAVSAFVTGTAAAQIGTGLATGKYGTFNTYSAFSLDPGHFNTYNQGRVWAGAGASGFTTIRNVNLWQASNNLTFAYGIWNHFDILASIGTYQDLNIRAVRDAKAKVPGDVYLMLRSGSHEFSEGTFGLAGAATVRLPTGGQNNIPFEVYKSDGIEFGIMGMATYYGNPYYKDQALVVNANLGWWNHLDNGRRVAPIKISKDADSAFSDANAMHLQYGLGLLFPVSKFQLMLDMHGVAYLTKPNKFVFSRESFMYVSPGFRYNLRPWVNVGVYVDILLSGSKDKTSYSQSIGVTPPGLAADDSTGEVANLSAWRLGVSLGFNILPASFSSGPTEQKRKRLLDKLLEEERGAQKASSQLDKLKSIRINAEKELDKIRQELEGGGQ